jgi:hypothetical protein
VKDAAPVRNLTPIVAGAAGDAWVSYRADMTGPPEPRRKPYTWAIVLVVVVFLCGFAGVAYAVYLVRTTCVDVCPQRLPPPPPDTCYTSAPNAVTCVKYDPVAP